jgi:hypothetical protein
MRVSELAAQKAKLRCAISRRGTEDILGVFASKAEADRSRFPALALPSANWARAIEAPPCSRKGRGKWEKTPVSRLSGNPSSEISSYTERGDQQ